MPTLNIAELIVIGTTSVGKEELIGSLKKNSGSSFDEVVRKVMSQKKAKSKTSRKAASGQTSVKNVKSAETAKTAAELKADRPFATGQAASKKTSKTVLVMKVKTSNRSQSGQVAANNPTVTVAKSGLSGEAVPKLAVNNLSVKKENSTTNDTAKNDGSVPMAQTTAAGFEKNAVRADRQTPRNSEKESGSTNTANGLMTMVSGQKIPVPQGTSGTQSETLAVESQEITSGNVKANPQKTPAMTALTSETNRTVASENTGAVIAKTQDNGQIKSLGQMGVSNTSETKSAPQLPQAAAIHTSDKILRPATSVITPAENRIAGSIVDVPAGMSGQKTLNPETLSAFKQIETPTGSDVAQNNNLSAETNAEIKFKPAGDFTSTVTSGGSAKSVKSELSQEAVQTKGATATEKVNTTKSDLELKTSPLTDEKTAKSDFSRPVKKTVPSEVTPKTKNEPVTESAVAESVNTDKNGTASHTRETVTAEWITVRPTNQSEVKAVNPNPTKNSHLSDSTISAKSEQITDAAIPETSTPKKTTETRSPDNVKTTADTVRQVSEQEQGGFGNSDFTQSQSKDKKEIGSSNSSEKTVLNRQATATQFGLKTADAATKNVEQAKSTARTIGSQFIQRLGEQINLAVTSTPRMTNIAIESDSVGKIEVQFSRDPEKNKATIVVDSEEVSNQIQKVMPSIVDNLNQKGIQFTALDVQVRDFNDNRKREKESGRLANTQEQNETESDLNFSINKQSIRNYGYNTIEYVA